MKTQEDTRVYHNTVITENYFNSVEYRFEETANAHIANNLTNERVASRNGGTGTIESNLETDDMSIYVDAENYDFHLTANLPDIIDAGIILEDVEEDYDCHERHSDDTPDIGADEYKSEVTFVQSVGENHGIHIYPNPSSEKVVVDFDEWRNENVKVRISDITGKALFHSELKKSHYEQKLEISLVGLDSGIYLISISDDLNTYTEKVVKN